jgi:glycosyltransferase involved in cell wall biosynthesis
VVNDGSTDETAVIAAGFAQRDSRIHVFTQPHQGGCAARNTGLRLAHYDWLLFLDADDLLLPQHLERMTATLASDHTLDAVHCGWVRLTLGGELIDEEQCPPYPDLFAVLARRSPFPPLACIVRRSLVEAVGGWDTTVLTNQDWDFWQRIARVGARFGAVPQVLGYYCMRPGSISIRTPRQFLIDGLRLITLGHGPDPRVPNLHPAHTNGLPTHELPCLRLNWVCWPAGLILGRDEDARPLLEAVREDWYPELDPFNVAHCIFRAVPIGRCQAFAVWDNLWPHLEQRIDDFLLALEAQSGAVGLAERARVILERLILEHIISPRPLTIGATHAVQVEVTQPMPDNVPPPFTQRLYCELQLEGESLGTVELPLSEGFIAGTAIADAIAAEYAWPILGRFFEYTLYPSLRIERDLDEVSLWRGSICLGTGLPQEKNTFWSVVHDQVGWTLFLQELWNRPDWPNEKFYDPQHVEASAPCSYFVDRQFNAEVSEILLDVVTNQQKLEVALAVGGAELGCVIVPVSENRVRAQEIRAALTTMGGFDLCRLAVRQGLIGKPLTDPAPLRARLRAAARQCHPDEPDLNPLRKILLSLQKSRLAKWLQK